MDLKFTFNGGQKQESAGGHDDHGHGGHDDHAHGGTPTIGVPLPFSTKPVSMSSVLELRVRSTGTSVIAEALSGDGVVYASGEVDCVAGSDDATLGRALRSSMSRAVAGLEGPLSEAVTGVVIEVAGAPAALRTLGLTVDESATLVATVDEALQRRIGVAAGIPITLAE